MKICEYCGFISELAPCERCVAFRLDSQNVGGNGRASSAFGLENYLRMMDFPEWDQKCQSLANLVLRERAKWNSVFEKNGEGGKKL